jgi:hypothetical protein
MIEPEIAFADLATTPTSPRPSSSTSSARAGRAPTTIEFFAERVDKDCITRLESFVDAPFERIDYTEAVDAAQKAARSSSSRSQVGHRPAVRARALPHRGALRRPVVVMNYPKDIKAFYMRQNDDGKTVAAMDVLAPGIGEIIGGSQREERLDVLDAAWRDRPRTRRTTGGTATCAATAPCRTPASASASSAWCVRHRHGNIRDVIPFPRTPRRPSPRGPRSRARVVRDGDRAHRVGEATGRRHDRDGPVAHRVHLREPTRPRSATARGRNRGPRTYAARARRRRDARGDPPRVTARRFEEARLEVAFSRAEEREPRPPLDQRVDERQHEVDALLPGEARHEAEERPRDVRVETELFEQGGFAHAPPVDERRKIVLSSDLRRRDQDRIATRRFH